MNGLTVLNKVNLYNSVPLDLDQQKLMVDNFSISFNIVLGLGSMVKNPPANSGNAGLIPRSGRTPGEGNGNPLQ